MRFSWTSSSFQFDPATALKDLHGAIIAEDAGELLAPPPDITLAGAGGRTPTVAYHDKKGLYEILGPNSIENLCYSLALKKGLIFQFDSDTCLNYPFCEGNFKSKFK